MKRSVGLYSAGVYIVALACLLAAGCNSKAKDQAAIRAGIETHLNGRADLNLGAMDHDVKSISINGDHATAQVEFRIKGSSTGMDIEYTLARQGKDWAVLNSKPVGMNNIHGVPGQVPSAAPNSGGQQSPQGHPPMQ
ncbi:MAG TPA: hypothetical protein VNI36_12705 [Candidatus Dormibacteraeota bacterium]|nr:hypothetical protein [Candidatus Dormibacteraeota bacterium]